MRKYKNHEDFRKSLEQKLRNVSSRLNQDLERIRRKFAFERFLARLFSSKVHSWLLKGGYAMELRFDIARATKDLDFAVHGISNNLNKIENIINEIISFPQNDGFMFEDLTVREMTHPLMHLLGNLKGSILDLKLVNVSELFEGNPEPNWVAANLVELKRAY
ncbi:MAG: nucleotidyl transferase AbiEii/AbiGii toxin family protein [Parachlamydiales bacterium]|nr:nucleotidyl transferase AbiEii/AbiGii toxin family protein [Parachlamydiales bacterium]